MAYALVTALRRIGLEGTELATATCGTIRLKLLKTGAVVTRSRAMANCGRHYAAIYRIVALRPVKNHNVRLSV